MNKYASKGFIAACIACDIICVGVIIEGCTTNQQTVAPALVVESQDVINLITTLTKGH